MERATDRTPFPGWTSRILLAAWLAAAAWTATAEEPFTLEEVLAAPFPSDLVASPSGKKVAWVVHREGVRNVWAAETPGLEGRQLTSYTEDDGQELSQLRFTPGEERLLFVRGGRPNSQGEIPNPLSDPAGAKRTIYVVGLDGGEPRRLAEGASPRITPDSKSVVYLKDGKVFSASLEPKDSDDEDGKDEEKPAELFKIRGRASEIRFSPDAERPLLAFTSDRDDHAFVGLYDLGSKTLRYLDPSVDEDSDPVFSPDGRRIAYLRFPQESEGLPFTARREGIPFSIRVADVATGEAREIWRAEEGAGSVFRWISAESQLFWGTGDRIVFPWEKDGWTHLYSIPAGGGAPTRGSRRQMLLGFHHRGYYHNAYAFNQYLASRGYIVLSVNYRSGIGYGMKFREALEYGASGASEYRDVVGAGLYLRSRDDVDPDRIGLWGGSYGGYLTALGLARASDLFAAGVDLHGVHDWRVFLRRRTVDRDPPEQTEILRLAFESSPMSSVGSWRSPVLLIQGDDDRNVPFSETVDLVEALRRRGVTYEHLIFPDEVHSFLLHRNWLAAYHAAAGFFDRHLRGDRPE